MNRNGGGLENLTEGEETSMVMGAFQPDWSPGGRLIAFSRGDYGCVFLFVTRPDGSRKRRVTPTECSDAEHLNASWSPQGDAIVYVSEGDTGDCGNLDEVRIEGLRGRDDRVLVEGCSYSGMFTASWQPVCTITGTDNPEILAGTSGRDLICGGGGDDAIRGFGGSDLIFGGAGTDRLEGGPDADVMSGQEGDDRVSGGQGSDWISDLLGLDHLEGNGDHDILDALDGARADLLSGGPGSDGCRHDAEDRSKDCG